MFSLRSITIVNRALLIVSSHMFSLRSITIVNRTSMNKYIVNVKCGLRKKY